MGSPEDRPDVRNIEIFIDSDLRLNTESFPVQVRMSSFREAWVWVSALGLNRNSEP